MRVTAKLLCSRTCRGPWGCLTCQVFRGLMPVNDGPHRGALGSVPGHREAVAFLLAAKQNLTHWHAAQRRLLAWYTAYKAAAYGQALRHIMPRNPLTAADEGAAPRGRKGRKSHH